MLLYKKNIGQKIQRHYQKIRTAIRCIIPIILLLTTSCVKETVYHAQRHGNDRTATGEVNAQTKEMVLAEMKEAWYYYVLVSQDLYRANGNIVEQEQAAYFLGIFLGEWFAGLNYINSIVTPPIPPSPPTLTVVCPV